MWCRGIHMGRKLAMRNCEPTNAQKKRDGNAKCTTKRGKRH